MIKKLRKKFVLINMLLVSVILIVVFTALSVSNYRELRQQSEQTLSRAVDEMFTQQPPKLEIGRTPDNQDFRSDPVFLIRITKEGEVEFVFSQNIDVSEVDLESLAGEALATGEQTGLLWEYSLRFMVKNSPEGVRIAFTEISGKSAAIRSAIIRYALFFALSLAAFFCVSLFFSHWALRPVERAWEQQRRFVSDASHELKTPLTVILANLSILRNNKHDSIEKQIKWVDNTEAEAVRMRQLIDSMLYLAKSDEAKEPVCDMVVNLSDLAQSTTLAFESVAFEQGIEFQSNTAPDLLVKGDAALIRQLFSILLDNALKYSGAGGAVTLNLAELQGKAVLTVRNTGPAISAEDLPHLFERFYRADKSRARESEGYGLGLSIAKSIVDTHHGKITVKSTAESGTTFTVALPLVAKDNKAKSV